MIDLDKIREYYASLIIIQYRIKEKAVGMVKCIINQALCNGLLQNQAAAWDLETAVGDQLTILGKIVGVPRNVVGLDLGHTFFNFTRYSGTPASIGFGLYSDSPYPTDLFYRYTNFATYTLTDFELRTLIKLKIIYNNTYSSTKNLKDAIFEAFDGTIDIVDWWQTQAETSYFNFTSYFGEPASNGFGLYSDSPYIGSFFTYDEYGNMTITYNVEEQYHNAFQAGIYLGIIPKPMGVELFVNYI